MIIKRYIYITRCREGSLNKEALLDYIHYHFDLERNFLVHKKGSINIFENKLNPLNVLLGSLGTT